MGAQARRAGAACGAADQVVSAAGDLDQGIEAEKQAFGAVFASEDAREGISAFLGKRQAKFSGR